MEQAFFDLYEGQDFLSIEVGHSPVVDWTLRVYDRKGLALNERNVIVSVQDVDRALVFAKAYALLAEYLSEHRGGY